MAVIQGSSAYSTKAELIPGIWRGFSAVQLLPVLSAGLGCSFGQCGENGGFFCLFPVAPSLPPLSSLFCLSCSSRVSLLSVSLSAMGYSAALAAVSPSADLGRLLPLWLLLAVSPVPRLWRWRSSLCPCFSPSSLCYRSALRGLLSSVLALRLLSVRLLAVAVRLSVCHDLRRLRPLSSVCPSTSGGWLAVCAGQFRMVNLHK